MRRGSRADILRRTLAIALWHRLCGIGSWGGSLGGGVREWQITSGGRRPPAGRSPPEGASVSFALILLPLGSCRSRRNPVRFPYSHVESHWVLRESDPVRSRWDARRPNSVCPTSQTRSTSKVRLFEFGDCGPPI